MACSYSPWASRSAICRSMRVARLRAILASVASASSRNFSPISATSARNSSGGMISPVAWPISTMACLACATALLTTATLIGFGRSGIGVGSTPHGCSPAGSTISRIHAEAARHFTSVSGAQTMFMPPLAACIALICAAL